MFPELKNANGSDADPTQNCAVSVAAYRRYPHEATELAFREGLL